MAENTAKTIWLDYTFGKPDIETHRSLSNSDPYLVTFRDKDECIDYVTDLPQSEERTVLIISNDAAILYISTVLQLCEELQQIASIYILHNGIHSLVDVFASQTTKVQGIYTDTQSLIEQFNHLSYLCDRRRRGKEEFVRGNFSFTTNPRALTLSAFNTTNDVFAPVTSANDTINRQEAEFMYSQILLEILIRSSSTNEEMIRFFRNDQDALQISLNTIEEFENYYDESNSIYWYTRDTFLYRLLNKALREQSILTLFYMRHFIKRLHFQLIFLHFTQQRNISPYSDAVLVVYRGQQMEKNEFNRKLRHNTGGFFSVRSFFSTTTNKLLASIYAGIGDSAELSDTQHVLFQIHIDNQVNKFPYANIADTSTFGRSENEILFTMGAVFRILSVEQDSQGDWLIQLELTGEEDEELKELTQHMRKGVLASSPAASLGSLMFKMGKYVESALFYLIAIENAEEKKDVSALPLLLHNL
jgi:hypothetical protein